MKNSKKYRTWDDDLEERLYNYENLFFPFPQLDPKKAIAPMVKVILGETKLYRNFIPRVLSLGIHLHENFQWFKKTNWRLGKRHSLVVQSNEMKPATKI